MARKGQKKADRLRYTYEDLKRCTNGLVSVTMIQV